MKIGWIVPGGFDPSGTTGTIPVLMSLASELGRRHDLRVLAMAGRSASRRYEVAGVEVTELTHGRLPGLAGAAAMTGALTRWSRAQGPFSILHAFWADRTALAAGLVAWAHRTPFVITVGGGEPVWLPDVGNGYGGAGTRRARAVTRLALSTAGAVTAGTVFVARAFPSTVARRVEIIPLGIDCARFAAVERPRAGPPWRLVHVANLNAVKDQATLLPAFRRVVDRLGDVRLDCIGEDTLGGAVQRQARALGLESHVTFHGLITQDQLAPFYRQAHLLVLSSRHESQGVVILEAAAAGVATAGTCVGLIDTLAPEAARAVPIGDAAALADAIVALLLDGPAREAMGTAAQRFARAHDVAWTARAFEEIYQRLTRFSRSGGTSGGRGRTS